MQINTIYNTTLSHIIQFHLIWQSYTTNSTRAAQARVGFTSDLFDSYIIHSSNALDNNNNDIGDGDGGGGGGASDITINFAINLTILIDCLTIFGTSSDHVVATLSYSNQGNSLMIDRS
jgi:hypothetical protein